jgi:hypothetical protein
MGRNELYERPWKRLAEQVLIQIVENIVAKLNGAARLQINGLQLQNVLTNPRNFPLTSRASGEHGPTHDLSWARALYSTIDNSRRLIYEPHQSPS